MRHTPEAWRSLLGPTREAAVRLVAEGGVEMIQGGRTVDPETARGPVMLRKVG
ncbi:MAG TPA: DUF3253 domain-containing protein [Planctomycetota bacterium]